MQVGRKSCWRQLQASFFRLLCLIPTGFPVRSVDMQRATDNITVRQGDTAIIRLPVAFMARCTISVLFPRQETRYEESEVHAGADKGTYTTLLNCLVRILQGRFAGSEVIRQQMQRRQSLIVAELKSASRPAQQQPLYYTEIIIAITRSAIML
ncbi:hypothetical protein PAMA_020753 [Pampus argenteus]